MKRILLLLTVLCVSSVTFAGGGYEIKLTIKGIKNQNVQLAYYFGDKQYIKDSAMADVSGKSVFKGEEALPGGVYIAVLPSRKYFEMIVDKEQNFSMETDTTDLIGSMKIKGSKDNELFYQYLNWISLKGKQVEQLKKEMEAVKGDSIKIKGIKESLKSIKSRK